MPGSGWQSASEAGGQMINGSEVTIRLAAGGDQDVCCRGVPGTGRRVAGCTIVAVAVARQMVLMIPHYIVLAFLWLTFVMLSVGRASLQGDEEDGCGKDEAVRDRGRRNVYRWGLWQGDSRRAGIGRCRCRRYPARAWPRVLLVFDRDVVILHG
jgi:hypothetical protein